MCGDCQWRANQSVRLLNPKQKGFDTSSIRWRPVLHQRRHDVHAIRMDDMLLYAVERKRDAREDRGFSTDRT